MYRCSQEFSGRIHAKQDQVQSNWKILTKKTGHQYHLTIKMYLHTKTILGKYEGQHDHALGDDNLRFLRLLDGIRVHLMEMIHMGMDSKAIVSVTKIILFPEPTAIIQLKVVCESQEQMGRDYYITMHNISCTCWIAKNDEIHLDDNDAICYDPDASVTSLCLVLFLVMSPFVP